VGTVCIGVFSSIHYVLKAQKLLRKNGVEADTLPVPRQVSADCGIAVSFPAGELKRARGLLNARNLHLEGLYTVLQDGSFKPAD
jgi:hypothetical protein